MKLSISRPGPVSRETRQYIVDLEERLVMLRRSDPAFPPGSGAAARGMQEEREWQDRRRPALRAGGGFELQVGGERFRNYEWAKPSLVFAWPGELYRIVARRKIAALIDENRRLRQAGYGRQTRQKSDFVRAFEWAFLKYLDRRWPTPPEGPE